MTCAWGGPQYPVILRMDDGPWPKAWPGYLFTPIPQHVAVPQHQVPWPVPSPDAGSAYPDIDAAVALVPTTSTCPMCNGQMIAGRCRGWYGNMPGCGYGAPGA